MEALTVTKHSTDTSSLSAKPDYWMARAARIKLLGEADTRKREYDTCLANAALLRVLIARGAHHFLITNANP